VSCIDLILKGLGGRPVRVTFGNPQPIEKPILNCPQSAILTEKDDTIFTNTCQEKSGLGKSDIEKLGAASETIEEPRRSAIRRRVW
jgi:hypothetical protein